MVRIAIIHYSTYGHTTTLAKSIQQGITESGGSADIFQIPETLSQTILDQIHAPSKPDDIPVATKDTLKTYDAFLFGIPTRFGNVSSQWSSFWDATGDLWSSGELFGKPAGIFTSTGTGGGRETTIRTALSYLVHHGLVFIPLGYKNAFGELSNVEEPHGASPWGAGTIAGGDGSRMPSELELKIAKAQGEFFYKSVKNFGEDNEGKDGKDKKKDKKKEKLERRKSVVVVKEKAKGLKKAVSSKCTIM